jgi:hypothetical protein
LKSYFSPWNAIPLVTVVPEASNITARGAGPADLVAERTAVTLPSAEAVPVELTDVVVVEDEVVVLVVVVLVVAVLPPEAVNAVGSCVKQDFRTPGAGSLPKKVLLHVPAPDTDISAYWELVPYRKSSVLVELNDAPSAAKADHVADGAADTIAVS